MELSLSGVLIINLYTQNCGHLPPVPTTAMAKSSNCRATITVEDMANRLQFLQLMLTVTAVTEISLFEPHNTIYNIIPVVEHGRSSVEELVKGRFSKIL